MSEALEKARRAIAHYERYEQAWGLHRSASCVRLVAALRDLVAAVDHAA